MCRFRPYSTASDRTADRDRYQTVYAQSTRIGSGADRRSALHAGDPAIKFVRAGSKSPRSRYTSDSARFSRCELKKWKITELHREWYEIPAQAADAINQAKAEGRRVVAVGTTTVRTLEYAAECAAENASQHTAEPASANRVEAGQGDADAFIYPGYRFRIVDALLTNFHLPQSTLLMLVCALGGKELVMAAYRHAVEAGYRFYSYGDCMFVE